MPTPDLQRLDLQRLEALRVHPASLALVEVAGGRPCHVVGGAVRDALLGREWHDIDLLVAGGGDRLAHRLADRLAGKLVDLGRGDFASWRIVVDEHAYDLWDRGEADLDTELRRRDLTINALAYSIPAGELIDPCGGLADIRAGRLVAATPSSFALDPLRVLRLVRQQVELPEFSIERSTLHLARRSAPALGGVAAERVRDECERILSGERPWAAYRPLTATDLYPRLWSGDAQDASVGEPAHQHGLETAFPLVRQRLSSHRAAAPTSDWLGLAFDAVLVAGIRPPAAAVAYLGRRQFRTRRWLQRLERVLEWLEIPETEADQRRFLHHLGADWQAALLASGVLAELAHDTASWTGASESVCALAASAGETIFEPPVLLGGEQIMALLGITPGPAVGRALHALRMAQVLGEITTEDEARAFLRRLSSRETPPAG